jgi:hypothetical protein
MDDLQIRMIENQAAAIAVDALNSGDLMICQLANDALALVAEMKHGTVPSCCWEAIHDPRGTEREGG